MILQGAQNSLKEVERMAAFSAGDAAPDFALAASDGNTVRLSDYLGKRRVVLAFYPKDFSGG